MISRDFFSVANNLGDSVAFNLESDSLGGPFMTGTRVAEFVRMRQKAYRLARLNALTEVFGSMWLIGPERLLGVLNGVGAVLHVFQDVISGRGPVQDFSGLLAGETLIDRQAHPAAAASGVHLHE